MEYNDLKRLIHRLSIGKEGPNREKNIRSMPCDARQACEARVKYSGHNWVLRCSMVEKRDEGQEQLCLAVLAMQMAFLSGSSLRYSSGMR